MTNEQWLKSLDTEELAEFFKNCFACFDCPAYFKTCGGHSTCPKGIITWLKQERGE